MKNKLKGKYLYIGMMFFLMSFLNINTLFAASAVLSWDPPTTNADGTPLTDLEEYCVHYGTAPGSYTESINVGNVLTYQVNNLSEGVTYYFAATALDTSGNESEYSIEVSRTIPSCVQSGSISIASGQTLSGNPIDLTAIVNESNAANLRYIVTEEGCDVDPSGTYIEAENFTGTISQGTGTFSLETEQGGYLGSGYLRSIGGIASNCPPVHEGKEYQVNFPATGTYTVWIRGYRTGGSDNSILIGMDGNCAGVLTEPAGIGWTWTKDIQNGSNTINITTPGVHTINVWVRESNHLLDGIYITQGSETPSDASHGKEIDPENCSTILFSGDATAAQTVDRSGWTEGVKSLEVTGDDATCLTALPPANGTFQITDTTPPVISGVKSTNVTDSSVTVSWTTSEASDTQIEYGSSTSYGSTTTLSSSMVTSHNQHINGLSSSTLYHYRVRSRDVAGNLAVSGDYTFTTAAPPAQVDYYCDSDNDGYVDVSIDGSCTGVGCEPAGCQTIPGNDCNDSNPAIHQNAADDTCNGIDENCDGTPDNNYVMSAVTCGTGVCTSTGQIVCQSGTEVNTCVTGIPPENPETTCNDGLDNDCDGQVDEGCFPDITVSNVLLSEDFSSGIPDTWSAHGGWSTDNSCGKTIGYPFVGSFAIVDSSCTTTGVDELVTEPLDASSCSSVELVYSNQYYWYSGNIEIDVSSDGGTTWSNNISIGADDGYPTPVWKAIDISSLTDAADGQIKFRYANSSFDGFWALDNVWVTCQSNQVDFSTQSQMSSEIIMITNTGKVDLAINNIDVTGQDAVEFNIGGSDNCSGQTLMAGETCTFDVLFAPVSNGSKNAILSISSNDPGTPISYVSLTGRGTDIINPIPEIKVNGSGAHIVLPRGAKASVTIDLDAGSHKGREGDWWLLMEYRKRWYYYDEPSGKWRRGYSFYKQGQLDSTGPIEIPESSKLQTGLYTFQFGVDLHKNGNQDSDKYYYKTVTVDVQ